MRRRRADGGGAAGPGALSIHARRASARSSTPPAGWATAAPRRDPPVDARRAHGSHGLRAPRSGRPDRLRADVVVRRTEHRIARAASTTRGVARHPFGLGWEGEWL